MKGRLYEVLRTKIRRQKILYSTVIVALSVVALFGYLKSDGHLALAAKALYLKKHNSNLEAENKKLKGDMEALMPPCMERKEFVVTAYEKSARSCQKWARYGRTSSNTVPKTFRTAAVDPKLIQEGSLIYATGIGWFIAEDRGSAIKGHRMDIFLNSIADALTFGKKKVTVFYQDKGCFQRLIAGNRYSSVIDEAYAYE